MRLRFGFVILLGFFLCVSQIFDTFAYRIVTCDGRVPLANEGGYEGAEAAVHRRRDIMKMQMNRITCLWLCLFAGMTAHVQADAAVSKPQETVQQADNEVAGQVLDEAGQPLPGVTIRINGTKEWGRSQRL